MREGRKGSGQVRSDQVRRAVRKQGGRRAVRKQGEEEADNNNSSRSRKTHAAHPPVHAADPARDEDAEAGQVGDGEGAGHGGRPRPLADEGHLLVLEGLGTGG